MKKFLLMLSTMIFLVFGSSVFAEMKIGVVSYNKIVLESPQLATAKAELKKKFDLRDKELGDKQKEFQKAIEAFNKNGPTMKADAQKAEQQKIVDQQKKLQEMQVKFQEDLSKAQNEAFANITKKIEGIVNKIATEQKFDLILINAGVAYSKKDLDITDQVMKEVKK